MITKLRDDGKAMITFKDCDDLKGRTQSLVQHAIKCVQL
jgi:spore maturation protein CgeB